MEVAKTFDRDGVRYRLGDALPPNLDKQTLEHYKRYGMVREVKPSETKPAIPSSTKPAAPAKRATPAPKEGKQVEQQELSQETVKE